MIATANAKSIEEIKSFLSRQKEVYKIPYETSPAPRKCRRQKRIRSVPSHVRLFKYSRTGWFRLLAVKDEWFSDDLRKLDDDNVYRKLQGHWIIEMQGRQRPVSSFRLSGHRFLPDTAGYISCPYRSWGCLWVFCSR
mgnify:CR=1 FL=1